MPHLFICPNCGNRTAATERNAGFRRQARGCSKCGFGFLFELLDDYYPAPDAAFFVSDQDGFPDVYRLNLPNGQVFRVTTVATGVSGITTISPTLSVSRMTGKMLFTTFYDQGNEIRGFDAARSGGCTTSFRSSTTRRWCA